MFYPASFNKMTRLAGLVFLGAVVSAVHCIDLSFPPGFKFGAATATYQVEGAWNVSDKSLSIWDTYSHIEGNILHGDTGDVACDSYRLWRRDIDMAKSLGLDFYRLSLSWPRLLPNGFATNISEDGKQYYNKLIDGLLEAGMEPVVTLYHWDLPQNLQDLGGWVNPLIADWFEDYARVVFTLYGDRVRTWITLNEPITICSLGYGAGIVAPGIKDPNVAYYICTKNALVAHAKAYRVWDKEFRPKYHGKVSLANHFLWFEAASPQEEELTQLGLEYGFGRYCHPIFSREGGWPPAIEKRMAEISREQGYPFNKLPPFTDEEKKLIRGTADFLGFNHYTSRLIRALKPGEEAQYWFFMGLPELGIAYEYDPQWKQTSSFWFREYPFGIRKALKYLKDQYGGIEILITENGYSSSEKGLNDDSRVNYYKTYLEQVLLSIKDDGVNISGYTAWSLMDNFEWMDGYHSKFGLFEVDFSHPNRTRTPRKSAKYYASIIEARSLDVPVPADIV